MEPAYYLETGIRCTAACTGTTVFRPSSYREVLVRLDSGPLGTTVDGINGRGFT